MKKVFKTIASAFDKVNNFDVEEKIDYLKTISDKTDLIGQMNVLKDEIEEVAREIDSLCEIAREKYDELSDSQKESEDGEKYDELCDTLNEVSSTIWSNALSECIESIKNGNKPNWEDINSVVDTIDEVSELLDSALSIDFGEDE